MSSSDDDSDPDPESSLSSKEFNKDRHVFFFQMMHQMLPTEYQGQDINRLTLAYFVISALHLLGDLRCVDKEAVIEWVLSFQAHPKDKSGASYGEFFGFNGSRAPQNHTNDNELSHNLSHLASTYSALSILKIVGFDFSKLDTSSIVTSMKNLQQPNGSFMPIHIGAEMDVRFIYCAAISSFLNDWSGMDKQRAEKYLAKCQSYDGGFGLIPGSESHGGATYCAVASLQLMGFIDSDILLGTPKTSTSTIDFPLLLEWCLQRQAGDGGYQGRSNKDSDTCYAFWIGGTLKILGAQKFIDKKALRDFLLTCQTQYGGFSKFPSNLPDLYHSYYGLSAFSLLGEPGLIPLLAALGIGDSTVDPQ